LLDGAGAGASGSRTNGASPAKSSSRRAAARAQLRFWKVEKAIEHRQPAVFFFLHNTAKKLRSTPRWPKIAEMMKLPA
jgi:hypothetical protein